MGKVKRGEEVTNAVRIGRSQVLKRRCVVAGLLAFPSETMVSHMFYRLPLLQGYDRGVQAEEGERDGKGKPPRAK